MWTNMKVIFGLILTLFGAMQSIQEVILRYNSWVILLDHYWFPSIPILAICGTLQYPNPTRLS